MACTDEIEVIINAWGEYGAARPRGEAKRAVRTRCGANTGRGEVTYPNH